jgi:N-acetylmuramoyl-L-alanine amidase
MTIRNSTDILVIHCTQTPDTMDIGADEIKKWHKNRGFDTIGYHFVIRRDGTIESGRDINFVGAHAVAVNGTSIGIALVGGGTKDMGWENNFTEKQFESLKTLVMKLKSDFRIKKIIGHYQVDDKKECPSFDVPKWLEENGLD